jgi:peptidoglycan/xylan/chitin deacetylase (PgdA/CDA1 family)
MIKSLDGIRCRVSDAYSQILGGAIILVYHRIAENVSDSQLLCVSPSHFEEHLDCLRRYYSPVSLSSLRCSLLNGQLPRRGVVLTFDDGYVDNLWNAKPLLEKYDVPATMFVTSGYVGQKHEFFADTVDRIILRQEALPDTLTLDIKGKNHVWHLDGSPAQSSGWNMHTGGYTTGRHRCYRDLHTLLRPLDETHRQAVLLKLVQWAGCSNQPRPEHCVMNKDELRALSEGGLIEIGAHGVSHIVLAAHTVALQQEEVEGSKRQLEDVLGRPVTSFAYPYGGPNDISNETIRLVRQAGFELACTASGVPRRVTLRSSLFTLPRYSVRDWDGEEFARRLRIASCIYGSPLWRLGARLRRVQKWTGAGLWKQQCNDK